MKVGLGLVGKVSVKIQHGTNVQISLYRIEFYQGYGVGGN